MNFIQFFIHSASDLQAQLINIPTPTSSIAFLAYLVFLSDSPNSNTLTKSHWSVHPQCLRSAFLAQVSLLVHGYTTTMITTHQAPSLLFKTKTSAPP